MNNPTREYDLNYSLSEVREAIIKIPGIEKYKYVLEDDNQVLKQIRLHEKGVAWDAGYHIDFQLTVVGEKQTKVKIEVGKKRGAINDSSDASNVNYIMKEISDKLSSYLSGKVDESGKAVINENSGCTSVIVFFLVCGAILYFFI